MSLRIGVKLVYNAAENIIAKIFDEYTIRALSYAYAIYNRQKVNIIS